MKACKDIDFLSNFNKEKKRIINNILENLPKINGIKTEEKKTFNTVKYSELNKKWTKNESNIKNIALDALARKIEHMIDNIGSPDSVKPMLESICKNRIKKHTKKGCKNIDGDFLGYGHFRWDYKVYTLNEEEIKKIKEFFKIL